MSRPLSERTAGTPSIVPAVDPPAVAGAPLLVDLRSPAEHALDCLPGAVGVPLFDDQERAIVGTLYKRESPEAAFREARELARRRIASLVSEVAQAVGWRVPADDLEERLLRMTEDGIEGMEEGIRPCLVGELPEGAVVFYCWRGGLRSQSVVAFLRALGLERAVLLAGGYRAYRRHVNATLSALRIPPAFVLRGLTGVGKTLVLRELERLRPGWTVDLEGLAGHRSSILGMVGLAPRSQKAFETALLDRLHSRGADVLVLEGESRKVGDVVLPEAVWRALDGGVDLELCASRERRVDVLVADYLATPESRAELRERLPFLEERLGKAKWRGALVELLDAGRERELVEILLERYYDPLYAHSERRRSYAASFDAEDPAAAARAVAGWIEARAGAL